jgi:hypothetical protein
MWNFDGQNTSTPLDLVQEQIDLLYKQTEEWVVGRIETSVVDDEFRGVLILSPSTIDFDFEVITVTFGLEMYPTNMNVNEDIMLEAFGSSQGTLRAEDENEFVGYLEKILGSATTTRSIKTMMAVARGIE